MANPRLSADGKVAAGPLPTTILPNMTLADALDTARIHHVAGLKGARTALVTTRPFHATHRTISDVGLIGGGQVPRVIPRIAARSWRGLIRATCWARSRRPD
jgi:predicted ATPase with chaperone activity